MARSFEVCRDRVAADAWLPADDRAVGAHSAVLYVLSPPFNAKTAVDVSTTALALVSNAFELGVTAAKGESAGIAHGARRWAELARRSARAKADGDRVALTREARLAFAKRPLESERYYESVGFHLVGLPEVFLTKATSALAASFRIDEIADEMVAKGVARALKARTMRLTKDSGYPTDSFKFNPFGVALPIPQ